MWLPYLYDRVERCEDRVGQAMKKEIHALSCLGLWQNERNKYMGQRSWFEKRIILYQQSIMHNAKNNYSLDSIYSRL